MKRTQVQEQIILQIAKELATIETLAKEIRCSMPSTANSRAIDAVAREITSHSNRVKDLAYKLVR